MTLVISATPTSLSAILPFRDAYRVEMDCQIVHDSIHARPGWTREYLLHLDGAPVGYGSVAVGGPWALEPAVYEFYIAPPHRTRAVDLFAALLQTSGARAIEVQSNDPLAAAMLHAFARDVVSEKLLFRDGNTTALSLPGATFRHPTPAEAPDAGADERQWRGVVEVDGHVAATGGVLFHYNPPYGDIYMEVAEGFRRRGIGAFLVQELKRLCHERGRLPAARCDPGNIASRRTLEKAGFVPCGHMLRGTVIASIIPGTTPSAPLR
jgi:GNAT superfamily N-acetyltransferase